LSQPGLHSETLAQKKKIMPPFVGLTVGDDGVVQAEVMGRHKIQFFWFLFVFWWDQSLNTGLCACRAGALPHESHQDWDQCHLPGPSVSQAPEYIGTVSLHKVPETRGTWSHPRLPTTFQSPVGRWETMPVLVGE
jgi:hypothetical protein